eukprot:Rmarinus@m.23404
MIAHHDVHLHIPDFEQLRVERFARTQEELRKIDPTLVNDVIPELHAKCLQVEDIAATRIQALFRGHLGRKVYVSRLAAKLESDEQREREKQRERLEEGLALLEKIRLAEMLEEQDILLRQRNFRRTLRRRASVIGIPGEAPSDSCHDTLFLKRPHRHSHVKSLEDAAKKIQAVFRGYKARKQYVELLLGQFEREERKRREKDMQHIEEGLQLLERVQEEEKIAERAVLRRSELVREDSSAAKIQAAFRAHRRASHIGIGGLAGLSSVTHNLRGESKDSFDSSTFVAHRSLKRSSDSLDQSETSSIVDNDHQRPRPVSRDTTRVAQSHVKYRPSKPWY